MMLEKLKQKIISNEFVNEARISMSFNQSEYDELVLSLKQLAKELKNESVIDKELALYLYTIPQMIGNLYMSFDRFETKPEITSKLEEAWIELDALVIGCLV